MGRFAIIPSLVIPVHQYVARRISKWQDTILYATMAQKQRETMVSLIYVNIFGYDYPKLLAYRCKMQGRDAYSKYDPN